MITYVLLATYILLPQTQALPVLRETVSEVFMDQEKCLAYRDAFIESLGPYHTVLSPSLLPDSGQCQPVESNLKDMLLYREEIDAYEAYLEEKKAKVRAKRKSNK